MPNADQIRILEDRAHPRIMALWQALQPLKSVVRFMNTGAHPDDETSVMLAAMVFRDGINLSYACSTRGEGGQNDIGTEAGADLGALRTREMERACDVLNMRMYWHSTSPEDPITDFGFSKSGVETLGKWGHERTLARFVEIIRTDRPDIICPTFLDIPGQHGHHRAMTQAAHEVMAAAADPGFPSNRAPWQVSKLYLPAWSGAGQSYDDDEPPPPATLTVQADDLDPVSGWSWERIGQQSRVYHQTQGMGRWVPAGPGRNWPLHLAESHVDGPDEALSSGLPATLADLADLPGAEPIAADLREAGAAIDRALAAYPQAAEVAREAATALRHVQLAAVNCPVSLQDNVPHRLQAKEDQLGHVLRLALGAEVRVRTRDTWLHPGKSTPLTVESFAGAADALTLDYDLPGGCTVSDEVLHVSATADLTDPYRAEYDPARAPAPAAVARITAHGVTATFRQPFERPPVILPKESATLSPVRAVVNLSADERTVQVGLAQQFPAEATAALEGPAGWGVTRTDLGFTLTAPDICGTGRQQFRLTLDGTPAATVRRIDHGHIEPTARAIPAEVTVQCIRVAVPDVWVGYVGSGNDRVAYWLRAMGVEVKELTDEDLASDDTLLLYDTIVIGIFAMRFRDGLAEAMPRLHAWVEQGGTLITLYHRPWDNWDPEATAPRPLEIGQPSLRWRVTDESAEVTHLAEHPILSSPNPIGPEVWDSWVKERGLYFAKSWDAAYTPLLEMADPDEAPHHGALLVADLGEGRHIHTSLILHHQMEHLVPGAFALMANFIAKRE